MGLRTHAGQWVQVGQVRVRVTPKAPAETHTHRVGFGGFLYLNKLDIKHTNYNKIYKIKCNIVVETRAQMPSLVSSWWGLSASSSLVVSKSRSTVIQSNMVAAAVVLVDGVGSCSCGRCRLSGQWRQRLQLVLWSSSLAAEAAVMIVYGLPPRRRWRRGFPPQFGG